MTENDIRAAFAATWPATWPGPRPETARFGNGTLVAHAAPVAALAVSSRARLPAVTHWPRLAIIDEIWSEGGLDPAGLGTLDTLARPRIALLARAEDLPAGAAFVAVHDRIAMIHVIEVRERLRRRGAAAKMVRAAATWAQDVGASTFSFVTHERNIAARALCASLGIDVVGKFATA